MINEISLKEDIIYNGSVLDLDRTIFKIKNESSKEP